MPEENVWDADEPSGDPSRVTRRGWGGDSPTKKGYVHLHISSGVCYVGEERAEDRKTSYLQKRNHDQAGLRVPAGDRRDVTVTSKDRGKTGTRGTLTKMPAGTSGVTHPGRRVRTKTGFKTSRPQLRGEKKRPLPKDAGQIGSRTHPRGLHGTGKTITTGISLK